MTTITHNKIKFMEGSNIVTAVLVPFAFGVCLYFYKTLAHVIAPLEIKIEDVYTYTFNLFAIELGALLALFALFACKPTPFLERIKNTAAFSAIVSNTNITLVAACVAIAVTFVLGLLRLTPDATVTPHTIFFVFWCCLALATTLIYVRTIRLILSALA